MAVRDDQDRGADLDFRGDACDVGHDRHRLEKGRPESLHARRWYHDVVGHPHRVEAQRFGQRRRAGDVLSAGQRPIGRQNDADLEAARAHAS